MTKQTAPTDSGSFLSGLGIGLIGGAVGYFLFATEKGGKVRENLAKEWQTLQAENQPATKKGTKETRVATTVGSFLSELLTDVLDEMDSTSKTKFPKQKSRKKMFKGIAS